MKKLKLEIISLCNYADFSKEGKFSIVGIFDEIYVDKVPSSFLSGYIAFTVYGFKPFEKSELEMMIKHVQSDFVVMKQKVQISAGRNGKGNFIAQIVGLPLPSMGDYSVTINFDKEVLGSTHFIVMKKEEVVNGTGETRINNP